MRILHLQLLQVLDREALNLERSACILRLMVHRC